VTALTNVQAAATLAQRADILTDVEAGRVVEGTTTQTTGHTWLLVGDPPFGRILVDDEMILAAKAGWVRLDNDGKTHRLTDTGRAELHQVGDPNRVPPGVT
jgi:hypothetical protein